MARSTRREVEEASGPERAKKWPPFAWFGLLALGLATIAGVFSSIDTISEHVGKLRKPVDMTPAAITAPMLTKLISDEQNSPVTLIDHRAVDLDGDRRMDAVVARYNLAADRGGIMPAYTDLFVYREGAYHNVIHDAGERNLAVTHGGGETQVVTWSHEGSGGLLTLEIYRLEDTGLVTPIDLDAAAPGAAGGFDKWLETLGLFHAEPSIGRDHVVISGRDKSLAIGFAGGAAKMSISMAARGQVGLGVHRLEIDDRHTGSPAPPKVTFDGEQVALEPIANDDGSGVPAYRSADALFIRRGEKVDLAELANSSRLATTGFTETAPWLPTERSPILDITVDWYGTPVRLVIRFRT